MSTITLIAIGAGAVVLALLVVAIAAFPRDNSF
jgi:hypothetical protein